MDFSELIGQLTMIIGGLQVQYEILTQNIMWEVIRKTLDFDLWSLHTRTHMNMYFCRKNTDIKTTKTKLLSISSLLWHFDLFFQCPLEQEDLGHGLACIRDPFKEG